MCSSKKDFNHHSGELKDRFLKQSYNQKLVDEQLEKVDEFIKDDILQEKDQEQQDIKPIPLILTYNRFLPNLTGAVRKKLNILQTNKNVPELFQEHPTTVFKRNRNLKEIIRSTRFENEKLKNSIFLLEQEDALHVYRVQELYVATKCWQQTHS